MPLPTLVPIGAGETDRVLKKGDGIIVASKMFYHPRSPGQYYQITTEGYKVIRPSGDSAFFQRTVYKNTEPAWGKITADGRVVLLGVEEAFITALREARTLGLDKIYVGYPDKKYWGGEFPARMPRPKVLQKYLKKWNNSERTIFRMMIKPFESTHKVENPDALDAVLALASVGGLVLGLAMLQRRP
jgi:hypothetical protein